MEESTSREKIFKKIRDALINKSDNPYQVKDWSTSVFARLEDSLNVSFTKEFTRIGGKFIYCESETDFVASFRQFINDFPGEIPVCTDQGLIQVFEENSIHVKQELEDADDLKIGITRCEYLIARLGSIMVSSAHESGRRLNVYPEIHVVVAHPSQIVPDMKDALSAIRKKYNNKLPSMITSIAGPSRTADIEKTLVMGAHGPKELYLFLIEDRNLK